MKQNFGRNMYGLAAIAYGIITLLWHQIDSLGNFTHPAILIYFAGAAELIGGLAIQWDKTAKLGSVVLFSFYFIFTLYLVPPILKNPLVYFTWGNFFEEYSIAIGSVFVFASTLQNKPETASKIYSAAYKCFGICVISYSLYQLFYLSYTAGLVPKWIPPGQMFWAVATTIAFAVAAYAILSGRLALLASRLLTIMFLGFSLLVWFPLCFSNPHGLIGWDSNAETLAVAGSVWIVADFIFQQNIIPVSRAFSKMPVKLSESAD